MASNARFLDIAPQLRLVMLLAINTGQRQGDLLKLPWSAYDGTTIRVRQRKTGAHVLIPVSDELKQALDATPKRSPLILVNKEGKPWSQAAFHWAWRHAAKRAGISDRTFHDLRGTAVVRLARAGCNEVEIYAITGHKPGDVRTILTKHYLFRDPEIERSLSSTPISARDEIKTRTKTSRLSSRLRLGPKQRNRRKATEINA